MASESTHSTPDLSDLLRRLQAVEDQLAIQKLIMTHPPAADSGDPHFWPVLFGAGGVTDYGRDDNPDTAQFNGQLTAAQVAASVTSPQLDEARRRGAGHIATTPIVILGGDEADAWNYHMTVWRAEEGFRIFRVFANYWQLARADHGWQVAVRKVRLLDGNEEAIDILRGAALASTASLGPLPNTP